MSEKNLMTLSDEVTSDLAAAMKFSDLMSKTQFIPKAFIGKPADVLACIMFGQEIGLPPMASLQNIAVINGTPSIYGDGMLAIVKTHPDFVNIKEVYSEENESYTCYVKRKDQSEVIQVFSKKDAIQASLWGKTGPWTSYPKRMLMFRARSWALRDAFPDVLKGLIQAEEAQDIPETERNVTPEVETEKKSTVTDSIKTKVKKTKPVEEVKGEEVEPTPEEVQETVEPVEAIEIEVVDQEESDDKPVQANKEEIVRKIKALSYHAHISPKEAKTIEAISAADPIDKLNSFYETLEPALFKRAQKAMKNLGKAEVKPDNEKGDLFDDTDPKFPIY